jgi:signal transduction histidine kinase
MAISFFNTILLFWLGLTVLLNAERRRNWGVWVSTAGLLVGGVFFLVHSVTLGDGLANLVPARYGWWYLDLGWILLAALPLAWYVVMLWYAGFWEDPPASLQRRHQVGLLSILAVGVFSFGLLLLSGPWPATILLTRLDLAATPSVAGIPLLTLTFPLYLVLCIGLSLEALRRPGPSGRLLGHLARRRARPWLVATSLLLLAVSLVVAAGMFWVARNAAGRTLYGLFVARLIDVARLDLVLSGLIGLSILTLGQAIVAYEVFTGKTLPRRGLRRYWRNAVLLALGYGVAVGLSQLLAALLMTLFYALLSWRSYAQREQYIQQLRPFVSSQRLYEQLVAPAPAPSPFTDAVSPFGAMCRDVLDARRAYLVALGPLAPLIGPPLVYPPGAGEAPAALGEVRARFRSPETMFVPLDPGRYAGATWAVPLWSERGLIGVLLLGEKRDGGLYTQEEIEIARATGERLIDTQASAEMARRLMALQRRRLAESQVLDRRTRRALHDDVLPQLHAALLSLRNGRRDMNESVALLTDVHRQISTLLREMPPSVAPEVARRGLVGALRHVVQAELEGAFDGVTWRVAPEAETALRALPPLTSEVLFYAAREAMRNAARHARAEGRPLHLALSVRSGDGQPGTGGLQVVIEDDGVGMRGDGGGQGLALHSTMMAVVGGSLAVESLPGAYTRVVLALPVRLD